MPDGMSKHAGKVRRGLVRSLHTYPRLATGPTDLHF
jgi:hypothetical protein